MNALQKQNLIKDATARSKYQPEIIFYIMIKDGQGSVIPNIDVAVALKNQGFRVYAKMKNGELVL